MASNRTRPIPIRMPDSMIARLDEIAGDHIEGRSGVVRRAVEELFARLESEAQQKAA
jgi:metal-responsive CopG/Arc/MetJ family transcriptional regulator